MLILIELELSCTRPSIAKATFAILYAEASKRGTNFSSAGGHNYAGVQTDNARWGGGASNFISARFQRIDSGGVAREFASFNSNKEFNWDILTSVGTFHLNDPVNLKTKLNLIK